MEAGGTLKKKLRKKLNLTKKGGKSWKSKTLYFHSSGRI